MDAAITEVLNQMRNHIQQGGHVDNAMRLLDKISARIEHDSGAIARMLERIQATQAIIDGLAYPLGDLQKCAKREKEMRQRVYPNRVRSNKMSEHEATRQTEMMQEIQDLIGDLFPIWVNDPADDSQGDLFSQKFEVENIGESVLVTPADKDPFLNPKIQLFLQDRSLYINDK